MLDKEQYGRIFRDAWIKGVKSHYPGEPEESYVRPWEQMDKWEQESAIAVFLQLRGFLLAGIQNKQLSSLTREQGGRLVRIAWVAQMYKHFPNPEPAYVYDWEEMSDDWERSADMDLFQAVEKSVKLELQASV